MRKLSLLFALCLASITYAAQQPVNVGTSANDHTGDTLRNAYIKLNANDAELYGKFPVTVVNGGTGVTTITGVLKGNGTSAITAASVSDLLGLFTGSCTISVPLRGDGSCGTIPSTSVSGLAASATTDTTNATNISSGTLVVSRGGTGAGTLTAHGVLLGEGTGAISAVAALPADNLLLGQGTTADPAAVALLNCADGTHALGYSTSTHTFSCQALTIPATPVTVANGGTGVATLTAHGVLLGEGTSNVSSVAAMAADTLLQGQGATSDPAAVSVPNCGSSSAALSYNTSTHAFGCQTISGSGTSVLVAIKTTGTTRTSTTTVTDDPDLVFTSVAAGNHTLSCFLNVTLAASGTTPGWKATFHSTGTLSFTPAAIFTGVSNSGFAGNSPQMNGAGAAMYNASVNGTNDGWWAAIGFVTTTSGTISLQWAQQNSSSNGTTVAAGSYCHLT